MIGLTVPFAAWRGSSTLIPWLFAVLATTATGCWAQSGPGWGLLLETSAGYDNNITRAKTSGDQLQDTSVMVNLSKSQTVGLTGNSRLVLAGVLGGERFQNYTGLSHLDLGLEAEWQYRESSDFSAPTLGLFAKLKVEDYETDVRDGQRLSLGLSLTQPLTDRITLFSALASNQRFATSKVFSTADTSVRMNLDYALSAHQTIYLGGEYRNGDVVSTGRASLENVTISKIFVQDSAFSGGQFFSYKVDGTTWLATLGYNQALGPRQAIDLSWRHVESTPLVRPSWANSARSYVSDQVFATYLLRF
jgi:hypothetical protein